MLSKLMLKRAIDDAGMIEEFKDSFNKGNVDEFEAGQFPLLNEELLEMVLESGDISLLKLLKGMLDNAFLLMNKQTLLKSYIKENLEGICYEIYNDKDYQFLEHHFQQFEPFEEEMLVSYNPFEMLQRSLAYFLFNNIKINNGALIRTYRKMVEKFSVTFARKRKEIDAYLDSLGQ